MKVSDAEVVKDILLQPAARLPVEICSLGMYGHCSNAKGVCGLTAPPGW